MPWKVNLYAQSGQMILDKLIWLGECESAEPNKDLYSYSGTLKIGDKRFGLD